MHLPPGARYPHRNNCCGGSDDAGGLGMSWCTRNCGWDFDVWYDTTTNTRCMGTDGGNNFNNPDGGQCRNRNPSYVYHYAIYIR
jgi:hypothetical protein